MPRVNFDFRGLQNELQKLASVVAEHDREAPSHGVDCACLDGITMGFRIAFKKAFVPDSEDRDKTAQRGRLIISRTARNWDY